MENAIPKIKAGVTGKPIAALVGATVGFLVARQVGYHNSFTVIPFTVVGAILGYTVGRHF